MSNACATENPYNNSTESKDGSELAKLLARHHDFGVTCIGLTIGSPSEAKKGFLQGHPTL